MKTAVDGSQVNKLIENIMGDLQPLSINDTPMNNTRPHIINIEDFVLYK